MNGFMIRGWILSSPGAAGFTDLSQSAISQRVEISTPCGAVLIRGTTVFALSLL